MDPPSDGDTLEDAPPYSRLFVVCGRKCSREQLNTLFSPFGTIVSCHIALDRSKKSRGFAFIQYGAASSAALAIEEMNMKVSLDGKPLKVMIAEGRSSACKEKPSSYYAPAQGKRQRPHTPKSSNHTDRAEWPEERDRAEIVNHSSSPQKRSQSRHASSSEVRGNNDARGTERKSDNVENAGYSTSQDQEESESSSKRQRKTVIVAKTSRCSCTGVASKTCCNGNKRIGTHDHNMAFLTTEGNENTFLDAEVVSASIQDKDRKLMLDPSNGEDDRSPIQQTVQNSSETKEVVASHSHSKALKTGNEDGKTCEEYGCKSNELVGAMGEAQDAEIQQLIELDVKNDIHGKMIKENLSNKTLPKVKTSSNAQDNPAAGDLRDEDSEHQQELGGSDVVDAVTCGSLNKAVDGALEDSRSSADLLNLSRSDSGEEERRQCDALSEDRALKWKLGSASDSTERKSLGIKNDIRKHVEKRCLSPINPESDSSASNSTANILADVHNVGAKRQCNTSGEANLTVTLSCAKCNKKEVDHDIRQEVSLDAMFQGALQATESLQIQNHACTTEQDTSPLEDIPVKKVKRRTVERVSESQHVAGEEDHPPRSRLFIVCTDKYTQQELDAMFRVYGNLEYITMVKCHGKIGTMAYAKYSKTSTAAFVMESFQSNGDDDSILVTLADPKPQVSGDEISLECLQPPTTSNSYFVSNANTMMPFCPTPIVPCIQPQYMAPPAMPAYPFYRLHHPPAFPIPQSYAYSIHPQMPTDPDCENVAHGSVESSCEQEAGDTEGSEVQKEIEDGRSIFVYCGGNVSSDLLEKLLSRFPGMKLLDLQINEFEGFAHARYDSAGAAAAAKKAFDNLEFPPNSGLRLQVTYHKLNQRHVATMVHPPPLHDDLDIMAVQDRFAHMMSESPPLFAHSVPMYLPQFPTLPPPHLMHQPFGRIHPAFVEYGNGFLLQQPPYPPQHEFVHPSLAPSSCELDANPRLFVVCNKILSEDMLKQAFEEYGVLEFIKFEKNKNYGYVKYTHRESAFAAIDYLDGSRIDGQIIKVMIADPPTGRRKRQRVDNSAAAAAGVPQSKK